MIQLDAITALNLSAFNTTVIIEYIVDLPEIAIYRILRASYLDARIN